MGLSAGEDGHWWLVRVDGISFEDTAWSPQLAHRIRTRVRWDREHEALRQLAERLAGRWPGGRRRAGPERGAPGRGPVVSGGAGARAAALRLVVLAVALVTTALLGPDAWRDAGSFALVALGVPLVAAALPFAPLPSGRVRSAVTLVAALVLTAWALLLGLGIGLFFLPQAALLFASAVAEQSAVQQRSDRQRRA